MLTVSGTESGKAGGAPQNSSSMGKANGRKRNNRKNKK
jgi:hypothetical protein